MSCVRCPYCAKLLPPFFSALNRISKSPSSIMLSKPISNASSSALLVANTSTSIIVDGKGSLYVSEAFTRPSLFQMTTPRPTLLSSANVAPSKLILYQGASGGDQDVCCWLQWSDEVTGQDKASICLSRECSSILSRGRNSLPNRRLLQRFHKFQMTREKSSGSLLPTKTKSARSVLPLSVSWFHIGICLHMDSRTGQQ